MEAPVSAEKVTTGTPRICAREMLRRSRIALRVATRSIRAGLGSKTGHRMGHMSIADEPDGTIAAFRPLHVKRKILIHINNSNPILLADSPERHAVEQAGWDVAFDGMKVSL